MLFTNIAAAADTSHCPMIREQHVVGVGRHAVQIDVFRPREEGVYPLVVLLHGSAGLYSDKKLDNLGEHEFACSGRVAAIVHYLDVSNLRAVSSVHQMVEHGSEWLEAADAGLTAVLSLPYVRRSNVTLLGESLGGYLAIGLGLSRKEVRTVVAYSAAIPHTLKLKQSNTPVVYLYHGSNDAYISSKEAAQSCAELRSIHCTCYLQEMRGPGHTLNQHALTKIRSNVIRVSK